MYMKRMIEVGKAANGYVVEVRVPIKPKDKKKSESMRCDYPGSTEKQFIAKDAKELVSIVEKLMPMLEEEFTSEEEFDEAFEEAAK